MDDNRVIISYMDLSEAIAEEVPIWNKDEGGGHYLI